MILGFRIGVLFAACFLSAQTFAIGFNSPRHHDAKTPKAEEGRCVDFVQGQQPDLSGHLLKQKNVDAAGPVQDRGGATGPLQVARNAGPMRFITNVGTPDAGAHFRNPSVIVDTGLDEPYTYKGVTLPVREWFRRSDEDNRNYGININQVFELRTWHPLIHRDDKDPRYEYAIASGAVWSSESGRLQMELKGRDNQVESVILDGREFSQEKGFKIKAEWDENSDFPVGDSHRGLRLTITLPDKSHYEIRIVVIEVSVPDGDGRQFVAQRRQAATIVYFPHSSKKLLEQDGEITYLINFATGYRDVPITAAE